MRRSNCISRMAALAVPLSLAVGACARKDALPPIDSAQHRTEWDAWKANRLKIITTPSRPLSFSTMKWLRPGRNTIGHDAANDIVLPGRGVPPRVGVLVRDGRLVRFEPTPGAGVLVDNKPATAGILRNDEDSASNRVDVGAAGFRVIRRVDSIGVRTWDADNPRLKAFRGLTYFPLDPAWRIPGTLTPLVPPKRVPMVTVLDVQDEYTIVGTVRAEIGDTVYNLQALAGSKRGDLFFTFADATAGDETYGFRFLHGAVDTLTNRVTLDFNYAYNPDCAFSPFTACPIPPAQNRIRAGIKAGELKFAHDSLP